MQTSSSHLVLIPSYNTGEKVYATVSDARRYWNPVWVVLDGSSDGTTEGLMEMARHDAGLKVWVLPANQGKGAAVLYGLVEADRAGIPIFWRWMQTASIPPTKSRCSWSNPGCIRWPWCWAAPDLMRAPRCCASGEG